MKTPNQLLNKMLTLGAKLRGESKYRFSAKVFGPASVMLALLGSGVFAAACSSEPESSTPSGGATSQAGTVGIAGAATTSQGGATGGGGANAVAGGAAVAGAAGSEAAVPADPACVSEVFRANMCLMCHFPGALGTPVVSGGLDLSGTNLGARLSKTPAVYAVTDTSKCEAGGMIIQPSNPARSVLLLKVKGQPTCGETMPMNSSGLTGADLKCIEDWVTSF